MKTTDQDKTLAKRVMNRALGTIEDGTRVLDISFAEYVEFYAQNMLAFTQGTPDPILTTYESPLVEFMTDRHRGAEVRVRVRELRRPSVAGMVNHYWETAKHKAQVMRFLLKTCKELIRRGIVHDLSKFGPKEAVRFATTVPFLADTEYGSVEYEALLEYLGPALAHHYGNNSHHPEFWDSFEDMPLLDIIEMLCDWKAATLRHNDGSILRSIKHNADRFGYGHVWAERFQDFVFDIGAVEDENSREET